MAKIRSLILTGFGINCATEMQSAYYEVGAQPKIIHLSELFSGKIDLLNFDIINFPGGFSYGDDLGAGRVLANLIKYKHLSSGKTVFSNLLEFIEAEKYIVGICNGFQVLLALGLLPGTAHDYQQEATLATNNSGKFEDRWVYCKTPENSCASQLFPSGILEYPIRHKEGKLIIKNSSTIKKIVEQKLIALQYCLKDGSPAKYYPDNPNQSWMQCAGLIHPNGRIIGIMPHPEAAVSFYNHPNWPQIACKSTLALKKGDGYWFFKKITAKIINSMKEKMYA